jgi:hypothetical protein
MRSQDAALRTAMAIWPRDAASASQPAPFDGQFGDLGPPTEEHRGLEPNVAEQRLPMRRTEAIRHEDDT